MIKNLKNRQSKKNEYREKRNHISEKRKQRGQKVRGSVRTQMSGEMKEQLV